jgi:hypothetical protein
MKIHYVEEIKLTSILTEAIKKVSLSENTYEELQEKLAEGYLREYNK